MGDPYRIEHAALDDYRVYWQDRPITCQHGYHQRHKTLFAVRACLYAHRRRMLPVVPPIVHREQCRGCGADLRYGLHRPTATPSGCIHQPIRRTVQRVAQILQR